MRIWARILMIGLILVVVAGAGGWLYYWKFAPPKNEFRMAAVKRGTVMQTISSTGTVEPEEVVDVGAQVTTPGLIISFGQDAKGKTVDYQSPVKTGTVLAKIDDSLYQADLQTAKAQLAQAVAAVEVANATLDQMQASLLKASQDWDRAQKLGPGDALAQSDYDGYRAAYETAKANVALAKAQITSNQAGVLSAQAALAKAQTNLDYCTITSPVDGVVIDRRVNIGETVVSSLSTSSLFLIAEDLNRIQVWVSVDEADIGSIVPGQKVNFTVDAYPGRTFVGTVGKVRYNATMTNNVVTYTVEVETDNSDGKLLPYLTANAKFLVAERDDVLVVPNSALHWLPPKTMVDPKDMDQYDALARRQAASDNASATPGPSMGGGGQGGHHHSTTGPSTRPANSGPHGHGAVWIQSGKFLTPIAVTTGLSDGANTEIQSDQLQEGQMVILGQVDQGAAASGGPSPFMPQLRSANRQQPGQPGSTSTGGSSGGGGSGGGGGGSGGGGGGGSH